MNEDKLSLIYDDIAHMVRETFDKSEEQVDKWPSADFTQQKTTLSWAHGNKHSEQQTPNDYYQMSLELKKESRAVLNTPLEKEVLDVLCQNQSPMAAVAVDMIKELIDQNCQVMNLLRHAQQDLNEASSLHLDKKELIRDNKRLKKENQSLKANQWKGKKR